MAICSPTQRSPPPASRKQHRSSLESSAGQDTGAPGLASPPHPPPPRPLQGALCCAHGQVSETPGPWRPCSLGSARGLGRWGQIWQAKAPSSGPGPGLTQEPWQSHSMVALTELPSAHGRWCPHGRSPHSPRGAQTSSSAQPPLQGHPSPHSHPPQHFLQLTRCGQALFWGTANAP